MGLTLGSMFSRPQKCAQSEKSAFFKIKKNLHFRSTPFLLVFCFKCDATCTRQKKKKKKKLGGKWSGQFFGRMTALLLHHWFVFFLSPQNHLRMVPALNIGSGIIDLHDGRFLGDGMRASLMAAFQVGPFFYHVLSPNTLSNACAR